MVVWVVEVGVDVALKYGDEVGIYVALIGKRADCVCESGVEGVVGGEVAVIQPKWDVFGIWFRCRRGKTE